MVPRGVWLGEAPGRLGDVQWDGEGGTAELIAEGRVAAEDGRRKFDSKREEFDRAAVHIELLI